MFILIFFSIILFIIRFWAHLGSNIKLKVYISIIIGLFGPVVNTGRFVNQIYIPELSIVKVLSFKHAVLLGHLVKLL